MRVLLIDNKGFHKYMDIPEIIPIIEIAVIEPIKFNMTKEPDSSKPTYNKVAFRYFQFNGRHHVYLQDD